MRKLHWNAAAALGLAAILGCGGGGSGGGTPVAQCSVHADCGAGLFCSTSACVALPSGECRKEADCSTGQSCVANACQAATVAECDKPANVARKAALVAAQPALGVRTKAVLGAATSFSSVAGDATVQCPFTLSFKDANGNGALDAYEDWTKAAQARAADAGWLNGAGDGTQSGDKGNAGNGSGKVLPAPPGQPYVSAGCTYFVAGDFNLDYVRSVSTGYGTLTNDVSSIGAVQVATDAEKMANSDYVFVRLAAPYALDADAAAVGLALPTAALTYGSSSALAPVEAARDAITAWNAAHPTTPSRAQIVVAVDGGRPSVLSEVEAYDPSGLYVSWGVTDPSQPDKVFLDVAFGIVAGNGKLPVALPASEAAASAQLGDVAGDGADATFVKGFGLQTAAF